jgi:hypothetical protein
MHRAAVEALRGDAPAPTRSALGLAIASGQEDDVRQWIAAHGLTCTAAVRGMRYLTCTNVPADDARQTAQDAVQDLTFSFDSRKRLVGMSFAVASHPRRQRRSDRRSKVAFAVNSANPPTTSARLRLRALKARFRRRS